MLKKLTSYFYLSPTEDVLDEFEQIYREHREYVRHVLYWLVRSELIDELVQETFIKAWKNYGDFKKESHVKTWLYRIARNCALDFIKKESRHNNENREEISDNADLEMKDLISKALMALNLEQREVFILYYKFGHTTKEISEILKVKEGTVKSRLSYSRDKVKNFFSENGVLDG
jgi:RNA polymerase sigma-70 factor (ECF subfamily)